MVKVLQLLCYVKALAVVIRVLQLMWYAVAVVLHFLGFFYVCLGRGGGDYRAPTFAEVCGG